MTQYFRKFPDPEMDDGLFAAPTVAGRIAANEFFGVQTPASESVYIGAAGKTAVYVGARPDAQLYLGAKSLWL